MSWDFALTIHMFGLAQPPTIMVHSNSALTLILTELLLGLFIVENAIISFYRNVAVV